MTISSGPDTVYRGGGRRWLTLKAACRAEAKAAWKRHYPDKEEWDWEQYGKVVGRLARRYYRAFRQGKTW